MELKYTITLSLFIIILHFITFSNSKSIVKNLPGFDGDLPFTLETGYIGVGEDEAVQVFYYFVESERNPSADPLLLHLTGGPGTSGLYPFLYQIAYFLPTSMFPRSIPLNWSLPITLDICINFRLKTVGPQYKLNIARCLIKLYAKNELLFLDLTLYDFHFNLPLKSIGPLSFNFENSWKNNITLELNPNSWSKAANVIFVDLPVGVGFSYAKTWEASRSSDSIDTLHSYEFLRKWLVENPRFLSNPLYISGISYMGIIIPNVALEIYNDNERGNQPQLNIKGCLLISPLTDKFIDFNSRFEAAHRLVLISDELYQATKETCHGNYIHNDPENILCSNNLERVDECTSGINLLNILDPLCNETNMKPTCREAANVFIDAWANNKDVQKALDVREGIIEKWEYVNISIRYYFDKDDTIYYSYDVFSSIADHQQLLTKNCQVLIICGDHDMTFPYVGTQKWITSFNLSIESQWEPWFVRKQVAGYEMTYAQSQYSLKFATIKGAGHSVALYKPEEALVMMDRWLASHTYSSGL